MDFPRFDPAKTEAAIRRVTERFGMGEDPPAPPPSIGDDFASSSSQNPFPDFPTGTLSPAIESIIRRLYAKTFSGPQFRTTFEVPRAGSILARTFGTYGEMEREIAAETFGEISSGEYAGTGERYAGITVGRSRVYSAGLESEGRLGDAFQVAARVATTGLGLGGSPVSKFHKALKQSLGITRVLPMDLEREMPPAARTKELQTVAVPENIDAGNWPTWTLGKEFVERSGQKRTAFSLLSHAGLTGALIEYDVNAPEEAKLYGITNVSKTPKRARIAGLQTPVYPRGMETVVPQVRKPVPTPGGETILQDPGTAFRANVAYFSGLPEGMGIYPEEYGPFEKTRHGLLPLRVGGRSIDPKDVQLYGEAVNRGGGRYAIASVGPGEKDEITLSEKQLRNVRLTSSRMSVGMTGEPAVEYEMTGEAPNVSLKGGMEKAFLAQGKSEAFVRGHHGLVLPRPKEISGPAEMMYKHLVQTGQAEKAGLPVSGVYDLETKKQAERYYQQWEAEHTKMEWSPMLIHPQNVPAYTEAGIQTKDAPQWALEAHGLKSKYRVELAEMFWGLGKGEHFQVGRFAVTRVGETLVEGFRAEYKSGPRTRLTERQLAWMAEKPEWEETYQEAFNAREKKPYLAMQAATMYNVQAPGAVGSPGAMSVEDYFNPMKVSDINLLKLQETLGMPGEGGFSSAQIFKALHKTIGGRFIQTETGEMLPPIGTFARFSKTNLPGIYANMAQDYLNYVISAAGGIQTEAGAQQRGAMLQRLTSGMRDLTESTRFKRTLLSGFVPGGYLPAVSHPMIPAATTVMSTTDISQLFGGRALQKAYAGELYGSVMRQPMPDIELAMGNVDKIVPLIQARRHGFPITALKGAMATSIWTAGLGIGDFDADLYQVVMAPKGTPGRSEQIQKFTAEMNFMTGKQVNIFDPEQSRPEINQIATWVSNIREGATVEAVTSKTAKQVGAAPSDLYGEGNSSWAAYMNYMFIGKGRMGPVYNWQSRVEPFIPKDMSRSAWLAFYQPHLDIQPADIAQIAEMSQGLSLISKKTGQISGDVRRVLQQQTELNERARPLLRFGGPVQKPGVGESVLDFRTMVLRTISDVLGSENIPSLEMKAKMLGLTGQIDLTGLGREDATKVANVLGLITDEARQNWLAGAPAGVMAMMDPARRALENNPALFMGGLFTEKFQELGFKGTGAQLHTDLLSKGKPLSAWELSRAVYGAAAAPGSGRAEILENLKIQLGMAPQIESFPQIPPELRAAKKQSTPALAQKVLPEPDIGDPYGRVDRLLNEWYGATGQTIHPSSLGYIGGYTGPGKPGVIGKLAHGYMAEYLRAQPPESDILSVEQTRKRGAIEGTADITQRVGSAGLITDLKTSNIMNRETAQKFAGQLAGYRYLTRGEFEADPSGMIINTPRDLIMRWRKELLPKGLVKGERFKKYQQAMGERIFEYGMQNPFTFSPEQIGPDVLEDYLRRFMASQKFQPSSFSEDWSTVPQNFTRLWRGEGPDREGKLADWILENPDYQASKNARGRWFGRTREQAEWYRREYGEGGVLKYLDMPVSLMGKFLADKLPEKRWSADPENEWFVPRIWANRAKTAPPSFSEASPSTSVGAGEFMAYISKGEASVLEGLRQMHPSQARSLALQVGREPRHTPQGQAGPFPSFTNSWEDQMAYWKSTYGPGGTGTAPARPVATPGAAAPITFEQAAAVMAQHGMSVSEPTQPTQQPRYGGAASSWPQRISNVGWADPYLKSIMAASRGQSPLGPLAEAGIAPGNLPAEGLDELMKMSGASAGLTQNLMWQRNIGQAVASVRRFASPEVAKAAGHLEETLLKGEYMPGYGGAAPGTQAVKILDNLTASLQKLGVVAQPSAERVEQLNTAIGKISKGGAEAQDLAASYAAVAALRKGAPALGIDIAQAPGGAARVIGQMDEAEALLGLAEAGAGAGRGKGPGSQFGFFNKLTTGFELFYLSRMFNIGTGMGQKGQQAYFGEQQAFQQAMFGAGVSPGLTGNMADAIATQNAGTAAWSRLGADTFAMWSPVMKAAAGAPGYPQVSAGVNVGLPALAMGLTAGHITNIAAQTAIPALAPWVIPAAVGAAAVTTVGLGAMWLQGQYAGQDEAMQRYIASDGQDEWAAAILKEGHRTEEGGYEGSLWDTLKAGLTTGRPRSQAELYSGRGRAPTTAPTAETYADINLGIKRSLEAGMPLPAGVGRQDLLNIYGGMTQAMEPTYGPEASAQAVGIYALMQQRTGQGITAKTRDEWGNMIAMGVNPLDTATQIAAGKGATETDYGAVLKEMTGVTDIPAWSRKGQVLGIEAGAQTRMKALGTSGFQEGAWERLKPFERQRFGQGMGSAEQLQYQWGLGGRESPFGQQLATAINQGNLGYVQTLQVTAQSVQITQGAAAQAMAVGGTAGLQQWQDWASTAGVQSAMAAAQGAQRAGGLLAMGERMGLPQGMAVALAGGSDAFAPGGGPTSLEALLASGLMGGKGPGSNYAAAFKLLTGGEFAKTISQQEGGIQRTWNFADQTLTLQGTAPSPDQRSYASQVDTSGKPITISFGGGGGGPTTAEKAMSLAYQTGYGINKFNLKMGGPLGEVGQAIPKTFTSMGQTYGTSFWGLQDAQQDLGAKQQLASLQYSQASSALNLGQFNESWQFNRDAAFRMRGQQREDEGRQIKSRDLQRGWQDWSTGFDWDTRVMQRSFAVEDRSYQDTTRGLSRAWQTEDLDESIRFSSGRQRKSLLKQRDRQTIMGNLEDTQLDTTRKREDDMFKREKERYDKQVIYIKDLRKLEDEQFDTSKTRSEEAFKIQLERMDIEAKQFQERWDLQEAYNQKQFEFYAAQQELQLTADQLSRSYYIAQIKDIERLTKAIDVMAQASDHMVESALTMWYTFGRGMNNSGLDPGLNNQIGYSGFAKSGDFMMLGGRRHNLGEEGPEKIKVYPIHSPESKQRSNTGVGLAAFEGAHLTLVVGDKEMDAYLKVQTRKLLTRESLRG